MVLPVQDHLVDPSLGTAAPEDQVTHHSTGWAGGGGEAAMGNGNKWRQNTTELRMSPDVFKML